MLNCKDLVRLYPIVKKSLVALTIFFSAFAAVLGDLKPTDSSAPVLQYFEPVQIAPRAGHTDAPNFTFDAGKPLLTIRSVASVNSSSRWKRRYNRSKRKGQTAIRGADPPI